MNAAFAPGFFDEAILLEASEIFTTSFDYGLSDMLFSLSFNSVTGSIGF
jgi:hypothetical protein